MKVLNFQFDPPPSTNNLFLNVGRSRKKTATYRRWINDAGFFLVVQMRRHENIAAGLPGDTSAAVEIIVPTNSIKGMRDLDNMIKPVLDLLVTHKVLTDDSIRFVHFVSARLAGPLPDAAERQISVKVSWGMQ